MLPFGDPSRFRESGILPIPLIFVTLAVLIASHTISPTRVEAAEPRATLVADVKFQAPFVRIGAPIPVTLDVQSDSMREVSFRIVISANSEPLLDYRSDARILTAGKQQIRMLLPPPRHIANLYGPSATLELSAFIDGKSAPVPLRKCPMPFLQGDRFGQHMAVVTVHDPPWQAERDLALSLTIPTQSKTGLGDPAGLVSASSPILVWMDNDDFPNQALPLCAYDVVCITPGALANMREAHLRSLGEWVRAGGNVIVMLDESPVKPAHVALLNLLADTDKDAPWFALDDKSAVRAVKELPVSQSGYVSGQDMHVLFYTGAGRSVVVAGAPTQEYVRRRTWNDVKAFLWRVPADMQNSVLESGTYQQIGYREQPANVVPRPYGARPAAPPVSLGQIPACESVLTTMLLRNVTTTVPSWVLLLILAIFILSVGPLQYRVLKRFNITRWTWVVFPLTAIVFTLLTIMLANRWIGRDTLQRSLVIVDVGRRNEFVRCNRFDLFFSGRPVRTSSDGRNTILSPFAGTEQYYGGRTPAMEKRESRTYVGTFPIHYQLEQDVAQWDPRIMREFSLEQPKDLPKPPWDKAIARKAPGDNFTPVPDDPSWQYAVVRPDLQSARNSLSMQMMSLSVAVPAGTHLLSLPHTPCGGELGDLALMDGSDASQRVLMLRKEEGRTIYIFRRLYHE